MLTIVMNSGKEYTTKKYSSLEAFMQVVQGHLNSNNGSEHTYMTITEGVLIKINQISSIEFND
ncbi:hypothetical protein ABEO94_03030 [Bacillus pumilus]|uniref:hypothetical protein n=1 Tax=Bacillus pumilus TaxID=1408 RepID=UPI003D22D1E0